MSTAGGTAGAPDVTYRVLGPLAAEVDGTPVKIGGGKARAILAMLALEADRVVSVSRLIDGIWGEDAADGVQATLQVHVSNLRKAIGADAVLTRAPGYLLATRPGSVDLAEFERLVAEGRAHRAAGDLAEARRVLDRAIDLWHGPPLADLRDAPFAEAAVPWMEERRVLGVEERNEVLLELGEHHDAVAGLEAAVRTWPHRERLWGQLMLALYRSGRQGDALDAYQRARRLLGEDLGIEPGTELRELEGRILDQDPGLDAPSPRTGAVAAVPVDEADPGATYRAPQQHNCRLELENGDTLALDGRIVIGRHPDCEVPLVDASVSRRHAELRPALGSYLLVDLGSTNGTLVNGEPVVQHLLADGDAIGIGAHELHFRAEEG